MKTVQVFKAEGDVSDDVIDDVTIIIHKTVTQVRHESATMEEMGEFYDRQADLLVDALFNALPQGTADRLWIKAMQRKVSLYMGRTNGLY